MTQLACDIVVIGGGIMGLAATYSLARAGAKVILVADQLDDQRASATPTGALVPPIGKRVCPQLRLEAERSFLDYEAWTSELQSFSNIESKFSVTGSIRLVTEPQQAPDKRLTWIDTQHLIEAEPALISAVERMPGLIGGYFNPMVGKVSARSLLASLHQSVITLGSQVILGKAEIVPDSLNVSDSDPLIVKVINQVSRLILADRIVVAGGFCSPNIFASLLLEQRLTVSAGLSDLNYDAGEVAEIKGFPIQGDTSVEVLKKIVHLDHFTFTSAADGGIWVSGIHRIGESFPQLLDGSGELLCSQARRVFGENILLAKRWRGVRLRAPRGVPVVKNCAHFGWRSGSRIIFATGLGGNGLLLAPRIAKFLQTEIFEPYGNSSAFSWPPPLDAPIL